MPESVSPNASPALFVGVLLTLIASYGIPPLFTSHIGTATIGVHLLLTAWMLWFWQADRGTQGAAQVRRLLLLGVLARLVLLGVPAFTTHDVERYLWDGAVALQGFDPYVITPNDDVVSELRNRFPTPEEHAAYPTLYPPLALAIYTLCALAGPVWGVWLWKLLITLTSIATLFVVNAILRHRNQQRHLALIALSPLMLLEVGIGAHVDALSALALSSALWAYQRTRWLAVGVAIGLGACIKLLPIAALGPILIATPLSRWPKIIIGSTGCVALIYGAALALSMRPVGNLGVFFDKWRNGSPINALLESALPQFEHTLLTLPAALVLGCVALYRSRQDLHAGLLMMLATPLLLSPVVFPWYLLILLPLVAIRPSTFLIVWLTTVPLAYEVLDRFELTGEWSPANWPLVIIALGWLIGAWVDRYSLFDGATAASVSTR